MLSLEIVNDRTGNTRVANYSWRLLVNGAQIEAGTFCGFDRRLGAMALVKAIADEYEGVSLRQQEKGPTP